MNKKEYEKLPRQRGIYKNKKTGRYLAVKKIKGKQFSESFDKVREAIQWRNTFDGIKRKKKVWQKNTPTLLDVWESMRELHFPTLERSTIAIWERRFRVLEKLYQVNMEDFKPSLLDDWIRVSKEHYLKLPNSKRYNLRNELNLLGTIFRWYRNEPELGDYKFISPILDRHKKSCIIRELPLRDKKISPEEVMRFLHCVPTLYKDLAFFQFLTASRIGEAAGAQIKNIDLEKREVMIKECSVWDPSNKVFSYLKAFPKNKQVRYCYINDFLQEIIERRIEKRAPNCDFLFHYQGKPINYCTIQSNYRSALRKAGLKFTGTHILRHGMATLTRSLTRSLDATMAMTGHKDIKLADHYSEIGREVQKETSMVIEEHLKQVVGLENIIPFNRKKD
ncbi:MAG: integrase [Bacteriovoracaceae bacterium]|jgi:integrase